MVIKCPNCGNWTEGDAKYCPHCGTSLISILRDDGEPASLSDIPNPIEGGQDAPSPISQTRSRRKADQPPRKINKPLVIVLVIGLIIAGLISVIAASIIGRVASMTSQQSTAYSGSGDSGYEVPENTGETSAETDKEPDQAADTDVIQEGNLIADDNTEPHETEDLSSSDASLLSAGYDYIESFPRAEAGQVMFEGNGLLITFDGLSIDEYSELAAAITVENRSDVDLDLFISGARINHYETGTYAYVNLPAGSTVHTSAEFYQGDLNLTRITNIGEIILDFVFYDPETNEQVMTAEGCIKTDDYDVMDTSANDDGYELGNSEGIRVVAKSLEPADDYSEDQIMIFYLQNNSDRAAAVDINNVFLNGTESSVTLYTELRPGTQAVKYAYISADDITYLGISRIDEISLHTTVHSLDTYDTIVDFGTADLAVTYED